MTGGAARGTGGIGEGIGAGAPAGGGSGRERGYNARALRPAPFRTLRARVATATFCAFAAALAAAPTALAGIIAPRNRGGSPNAEKIQALYIIAFVLGILIFLLVEGVLIYSLVKFRWRRGGEPPAQIRGNTRLEVGWTLGAASILVVLTVVTFIFLGPIKNPAGSKAGGYVAELKQSGGGGAGSGNDGKLQFAALNQSEPPGPPNTHLNIHVNGQQFLWRYDYPTKAQVFSYVDMYVPINTTVTLDITASDVDHSWWIPDLGGKADAIPGYTNHTWFRISEPGVYEGQCAELCGEGHADMLGRVHALTPDAYRVWVAKQAADIKESQALLALARKTRGQAAP
jgi:cytochrome c oxidase subunit II